MGTRSTKEDRKGEQAPTSSATAKLAKRLASEAEDLKKAKRTLERHILALSNDNQRLARELKKEKLRADAAEEALAASNAPHRSHGAGGSQGEGKSSESSREKSSEREGAGDSFFSSFF